MTELPPWVETARSLPLAFAQVREDALQDLSLIRELRAARPHGVRVLMVASGGCTAAALAAEPGVTHLELVDPNPAQLDLCRLKLHMLRTCAPEERLALLGHRPHPERGPALARLAEACGVSPTAFGPPELTARVGPDQVGRYERVFVALRAALEPEGEALAALLRLEDPAEQARRAEAQTDLGRALDFAFEEVFALPKLVALFGEDATANRVQDFSKHFAARTRHALATLPARSNPYLWQVLAGSFPPPELGAELSPWLSLPKQSSPLPELRFRQATFNQVLSTEGEGFDFIHLSNILDWLSPEDAAETLGLARSRLRPGGHVLIRQLNSTLDVRAQAPELEWRDTRALHASDRSYFYRALHLGVRAPQA